MRITVLRSPWLTRVTLPRGEPLPRPPLRPNISPGPILGWLPFAGVEHKVAPKSLRSLECFNLGRGSPTTKTRGKHRYLQMSLAPS